MGYHSLKLKLNAHLLIIIIMFFLGNCVNKCLTSGLVPDTTDWKQINEALENKFSDGGEKTDLERTVIQGLGLKQIINVKNVNVSQAEYVRMYNVYLKYLKAKLSNYSSDIKLMPRFYVVQQKEQSEISLEKDMNGIIQLYFNKTSFDQWTKIDHASLRMLLPGVGEDVAVQMKVYHLLWSNNEEIKKTFLVDSTNAYLSAHDPKWCEFDVTLALQQWIKQGAVGDVHLEIHCPKCAQNRFFLKPLEPAVINVIMNIDNNRDRRSLDQIHYRRDQIAECQKNSKKCCRQEMSFDLEKLGFNFIIQPKKFDAGICKGRCPPYYNAAHNHAVLQGIMWKKNRTHTPRVCCAPSKLTHLEVLTVDEEDPTKLTVRDLQNMVVLECACS